VKQSEKIDETYKIVTELKVVLLGKNSDKGIVGQVNSNTKKINRANIIIASIIGTGILGGGAAGLVQLLGG